MIMTRFSLFATEETVTRPVLIIVSNAIKELLGINKNVYTKYDVKDSIILKKTKLGNIKIDNNTREEMLYIESTEVPFDDHELALIPIRPDFRPIYYDEDIGAKFQPIHHPRRVNLRVKYLSRSKAGIYALTDRLKLYTANDGMYNQLDLIYHYSIPGHVGRLIGEINHLKNKRLETALTLEEYINSTFDNRVDIANSIDGEVMKQDLIIRESQTGIEGYITDDLSALFPEYQDDDATWGVEFEYTFVYEKPVSILLQYPLVIYNSMISKEYRIFQKEKKRSKDAYRTARSSDLYKLVEPDRTFKIRDDNYYLTIPEVDNDKISAPPTFYARMFSVLILVNEENKKELFKLSEIPKIKFRDHVLKYLLENECKYINTKFAGLFYIELYKDQDRDTNKVILDEDGTLRTEYDMDMKSTYRVVFNVLTDLNLLNKNALRRVKSYFQEELDNNEEKTNMSFQDVVFNKNKGNITQESTENMVLTYLNLINVDNSYVFKQLTNDVVPTEIPFTISDNRWASMKTKQIFMVLAAALEKK